VPLQGRRHRKMKHEHDFVRDLDGQVTCSVCGATDDEKELSETVRVKTLNEKEEQVEVLEPWR